MSRKLNLEDFLNSPEGQSVGGLDAGFNYVSEEMSSRYGINLSASLARETGVESPNYKVKIKAKNVVFDVDPRGLKRDVYFLYDPVTQNGRRNSFDMPNVNMQSFNGKVDKESIKAFDYVLPLFYSFRENNNGLSPEQIRKESEKRAESYRKERELQKIENEKKRLKLLEKERIEKEKQIKHSQETWKNGVLRKDSESPYFKKKDMLDIHQLVYIKNGREKVELENGKTFNNEVDMIPLFKFHNGKASFVNYQKIGVNGNQDKMLAGGMDAKGVFNIIGSNLNLEDLDKSERFHFAEGFATAYKVHKITNEPCFFCLNSNNLELVVESMRELFPDKDFVISADNDKYKTHSVNAGMKKATEAAIKHSATITFPNFNEKDDYLEKTDWDDYYQLYGKEESENHYLSSNNSMSFKGMTDNQKMVYQDLFSVKYSSHSNVWEHINDFLLPKDNNTSPKVFLQRFEMIKKHIPERAFMKYSGSENVQGKKKYNYTNLPGTRFTELSISDLVNYDEKMSSLDENTSKFIKENLKDYIDEKYEYLKVSSKNEKESNQLTDIKAQNLTNSESKDIFKKILPLGKRMNFTTVYPYSLEYEDSFYVKDINNIKENGKLIIDSFSELNRDNGHLVKITLEVDKKSVNKWSAIGDGESNVKKLSQKLASKDIYSKIPEIKSLEINGQQINLNQITISEKGLKELANYVVIQSSNKTQNIKKTEKSKEFHISSINVENEQIKKKQYNKSLNP